MAFLISTSSLSKDEVKRNRNADAAEPALKTSVLFGSGRRELSPFAVNESRLDAREQAGGSG